MIRMGLSDSIRVGLPLALFAGLAVAGSRGNAQVVGAAATATAEGAATKTEASGPGSDWVRVARDGRGRPRGLQTAVVRYGPPAGDTSGVTVDLIAAVHIGDGGYYRRLNDRFTTYDALLYELVAPPGTVVPKGRGASSRHPVGVVQNFIKQVLELQHQLACIDYTKKNFVHADMSPAEFARAMADRDESFAQMFFRLLGRSIAQQSKSQAEGGSADIDLLAALFDPNRALRLKVILAEQFDEMETVLSGFGGAEGSTLIEGRNAVALRVLREQIKAGKRHLGIFYGAGHLTDMDQRLRNDFDLHPVQTWWITAWDLNEKSR
jgi:hypothetical protein